MKTKSIVLALVFGFLLSVCCFAEFQKETVEISFKVGDSTLLINGEEKTVETPYVVGEGVTLVPVRVITEAFGAKVSWEQSEKKVTLVSDEKKIELWINKDTATVNGEEFVLLSPPELTNSVTMVPLRFISETFGANVSYDNDTKQISIVKEPAVWVKDTSYYYESDKGGFSAHVPVDYFMQTDENGNYEFVSGIKYNYSINTVIYSIGAKENIEDAAEKDREKQVSGISSERITVTEITEGTVNGIDTWYYQLKDNKKNVVVTKTFFNHGSMSYMILNFVTEPEYDVKEEEMVNLSMSGYEITVPSAFSGKEIYRSTERPASNDVESIAVKVFKSDNDADISDFLRYNAKVMTSKLNEVEYVENKIYTANYTVMENEVSAYEYKANGVDVETRGIAFEIEDHVVFAQFMTTLDETEIEYFIENLKFDFEKTDAPELEYAENVTDINKSSKKVETSDISFTVPKSFEVTYSKDKRLVIAKDAESDITLMCFVRAAVIDNDDEEVTMVPSAYYGMVEGKTKKRTVSETMSDTDDYMGMNAWDSCASTRRAFSGVDLPKNGTDSAKYVKLRLNSTWSYLNFYQVRTENKLFEDSQRLHAFVFSYTSADHSYGTMLKLESIMKSIKE